jgi:subtilisin family serine protease
MNNKRHTLFSIVATALLFSVTTVSANENIVNLAPKDGVIIVQNAPKFAPNEVIISFKDGKKANSTFTRMVKKFLGKGKYSSQNYSSLGAMHIKSDKFDTSMLMDIFKKSIFSSYIESVSPNNIMTVTKSNDSYYNKLWAIENTGQEVNNKEGTADADMDVAEAWEKTKGSKEVIVAVLDTGVDYRHSDLQDNMWNGAVNYGYDFAGDDDGNNDDNPMPDEPYDEKGHYHGTHVAGTIGAVGNNDNGVSGIAQNVSIMAVKVFRPNGYGYSSDIMEGLDYVAQKVDEGENIVAINASYGGGGGSQDDAVNDAIKKLGEKGVVFCAAAGNDGKDIDSDPMYPASYDASNIIAVAASDQDDKLASFSNYGKKSVDVSAPGTNILSTYPDDQYAYLNGTSMATPNVAGSVALIASLYPDSTVDERKAMILDNVDKKDDFTDKVLTDGRVNINQALGDKEEDSNNAPVAKDDSAETAYETTVTVDVLANDSDEDGDKLTIQSTTSPKNGTVKNDNGKLVYTPNDGFSGEDIFEYTITDGEDEATAKVTVTVEEDDSNNVPVAKDDSATTAYETAVTVDVLANDSDEDGDKLTIQSTTSPKNGTVKNDNGKLVYTPNDGFSGKDSFDYTISDGEDEATATVSVTVEEDDSNNAPVAKDDSAKTAYETAVTVDVLANDSDEDGDKLTIQSTTSPKNGTVKNDNGKLIYTPNDGFSGKDSFDYTISDGEDEATATVTVTVEDEPNNAPVAKDDSATTPYETAVTVDVLANDSDEDGDVLTIQSTTSPKNGTVKNDNGKLVYTPNDGFSGKDSFDYTISDGEDEATATVTVTVEDKEEDEEENNGGFFGGFGGWSFW